jgi:hypothetical protein
MSRKPLALNPLPRPERQRYAVCAAPDCRRPPRSFSRYCTGHARKFHRTRDPNGRAIRIGELRPHLELANIYLQRNASHPAVIAAEEFLRTTLHDTTLPGAIRKQMQRLHRDGAEPRAMLAQFLAVMGLMHYLPHTVTSDACVAFNIGNRVLRVCALPSFTGSNGKRQPMRIPPRVAEHYGHMLRSVLAVFSGQFWKLVEDELEAPTRAVRAVAEATRRQPLGSPQAAPEVSP